MSKIEVKEEEISESWKKKFNTDCKAFHVPLPSVKDHKEDWDRINKQRCEGYKKGINPPNNQLFVDNKLETPVVRYRK